MNDITAGSARPDDGSGRSPHSDQLLELANLYCEDRLTADQATLLSQLLRSSPQRLATFVEFTQIHAQLTWDAGHVVTATASDVAEVLERADISGTVLPAGRGLQAGRHNGFQTAKSNAKPVRPRHIARTLVIVLSLMAALTAGWWLNGLQPDVHSPIANNGQPSRLPDPESAVAVNSGGSQPAAGNSVASRSDADLTPLQLNALKQNSNVAADSSSVPTAALASTDLTETPIPDDDEAIIERINSHLANSWAENGVQPSPVAADHEWVRRAYLTFAGAIPTAEESTRFTAMTGDRRRSALVSQLLDDSRTVDNLSVNWLNLLIGRSNPRDVDEDALFGFLRKQFEDNRPWIETVGNLISAEGRSDQNGATNFLLAHLNDQATPATAVTARLFFGQQVQCTQCHDHPFARDIRQDQFWALNAFFKQTSRKVVPITAAENSDNQKRRRVWELKDSNQGGMTFYENRRGQQVAVLPEFGGEKLTQADGVSRRSELVRLLQSDSDQRVARAMVNRMWAHFFGAGFTVQIDDMGPHNPPSHPELLEQLTTAYVNSGYDTRRLMRWIALSDAWQRTSAPVESNIDDAPSTGTTPLFSRVYSRLMGPEEVYDSIRIAIRSVSRKPVSSSIGTDHRRQWVQQFVESYGTDENDERLEFGGNISQAMLMMNGEDIETAIPLAVHSLVTSTAERRPPVAEYLQQVSLAAVSRNPTESEDRAFRNRYRALSQKVPAEQALTTSLEDMLWAYLNSAEFSVVY